MSRPKTIVGSFVPPGTLRRIGESLAKDDQDSRMLTAVALPKPRRDLGGLACLDVMAGERIDIEGSGHGRALYQVGNLFHKSGLGFQDGKDFVLDGFGERVCFSRLGSSFRKWQRSVKTYAR